MANADYQIFRKNAPGLPLPPGTARTSLRHRQENAYYGISGAIFLNYPLSGTRVARRRRDRWPVAVRLLRRGFRQNNTTPSRQNEGHTRTAEADHLPGRGRVLQSRREVLRLRQVREAQDQRTTTLAAFKASSNQTWIAFGAKVLCRAFSLHELPSSTSGSTTMTTSQHAGGHQQPDLPDADASLLSDGRNGRVATEEAMSSRIVSRRDLEFPALRGARRGVAARARAFRAALPRDHPRAVDTALSIAGRSSSAQPEGRRQADLPGRARPLDSGGERSARSVHRRGFLAAGTITTGG